ncbi:MAG: Hsp70 family protein, partial [Phenylobacterium sp.]|nr:Hsp70 family protein [Phenylobacterium sp.]
MSKIIGIDLGTTNSCVAIMDGKAPKVIENAEGARTTPSVVGVMDDGERLVGQPAKRQAVTNPSNTLFAIKRLIGRQFDDPVVAKDKGMVPYDIVKGPNGDAWVKAHGTDYSPQQVSAFILQKMKEAAEQHLGEKVEKAVITVPAYFNDAQRNATIRAGELAGLTVERIVNEPTAAALAYGLDRLKDRAKIAVYDLGGGTFDLSILELNQGIFQVLATHGNTRLGGDDLDRRVTDHLVARIRESGGPDAASDPSMMSRIREAAEQAKIRLSSETVTQVALPFLTPDFSFTQELTREELERLTRDLIEKTRAHCLRSLADAKLEAK